MISVITPTHDRPEAWRFAERWMARQTMQPDEWIVADDGDEPAPLTLGQVHVRLHNYGSGARSLARNIAAAAQGAKGDIIVVVEDDDYYAPDHVEVCVERLKGVDVAGAAVMRYFNLRRHAWMEIPNVGSALCNTAFRRDAMKLFLAAADQAYGNNDYGVDKFFWRAIPKRRCVHYDMTVVGLKGLPGTVGLGIGHRDNKYWHADPSNLKLVEWLGSDAAAYDELVSA